MLNVLLVDDSDSLRYILKAFLKEIAHCDEAVNGREAVTMVRESLESGKGYDLILMDIMMPDVDGLDATRRINTLLDEENVQPDCRPKIVMLTCLNDSKHMLEAQYECGAAAYITKPFERDILFETIKNLDLIDNPLTHD